MFLFRKKKTTGGDDNPAQETAAPPPAPAEAGSATAAEPAAPVAAADLDVAFVAGMMAGVLDPSDPVLSALCPAGAWDGEAHKVKAEKEAPGAAEQLRRRCEGFGGSLATACGSLSPSGQVTDWTRGHLQSVVVHGLHLQPVRLQALVPLAEAPDGAATICRPGGPEETPFAELVGPRDARTRCLAALLLNDVLGTPQEQAAREAAASAKDKRGWRGARRPADQVVADASTYDARARTVLVRTATLLGAPATLVPRLEDALVAVLVARVVHPEAEAEAGNGKQWSAWSGGGNGGGSAAARKKTASKGRWVKIGLAGLGGAALIAVTGGLAAPALIGGIAALGAIGGGLGVAVGGLAAFLGTSAGTILLIGGLGAMGGRAVALRMARRTAGVGEFRLVRLGPLGQLMPLSDKQQEEKSQRDAQRRKDREQRAAKEEAAAASRGAAGAAADAISAAGAALVGSKVAAEDDDEEEDDPERAPTGLQVTIVVSGIMPRVGVPFIYPALGEVEAEEAEGLGKAAAPKQKKADPQKADPEKVDPKKADPKVEDPKARGSKEGQGGGADADQDAEEDGEEGEEAEAEEAEGGSKARSRHAAALDVASGAVAAGASAVSTLRGRRVGKVDFTGAWGGVHANRTAELPSLAQLVAQWVDPEAAAAGEGAEEPGEEPASAVKEPAAAGGAGETATAASRPAPVLVPRVRAGVVALPSESRPGWLRQVLGGGEAYSLVWESSVLASLAGICEDFVLSQLTGAAMKEALKYTLLTGLMAAWAWPGFILKAASIIDAPWAMAMDRSEKAGRALAELLLSRAYGQRPVNLVGFSIGARVIFRCLQHLARHAELERQGKGDGRSAHGIIGDVVLLGCPVSAAPRDWERASAIVSGRFVNCYSSADLMLRVIYRSIQVAWHVAGVGPVGITDNKQLAEAGAAAAEADDPARRVRAAAAGEKAKGEKAKGEAGAREGAAPAAVEEPAGEEPAGEEPAGEEPAVRAAILVESPNAAGSPDAASSPAIVAALATEGAEADTEWLQVGGQPPAAAAAAAAAEAPAAASKEAAAEAGEAVPAATAACSVVEAPCPRKAEWFGQVENVDVTPIVRNHFDWTRRLEAVMRYIEYGASARLSAE